MLVTGVSVPPHQIEQLRPRIDAARVPGELQQKVELLGRQFDRTAADADRPPARVDDDVAGVQDLGVAVARLRHGLNAAEQGLHARQQLHHAKRFRQVVVRAHFEADDTVRLR